jgi:hypothetical protein
MASDSFIRVKVGSLGIHLRRLALLSAGTLLAGMAFAFATAVPSAAPAQVPQEEKARLFVAGSSVAPVATTCHSGYVPTPWGPEAFSFCSPTTPTPACSEPEGCPEPHSKDSSCSSSSASSYGSGAASSSCSKGSSSAVACSSSGGCATHSSRGGVACSTDGSGGCYVRSSRGDASCSASGAFAACSSSPGRPGR